MTELIIMILIVMGLHCVWSCCKSNSVWTKAHSKTQPAYTDKTREVLRVWHYEQALQAPDPWSQAR
jgi:hypothetical protein